MNDPHDERNRRILVIDDNASIHEDFRKILCASASDSELNDVEAALFDGPVANAAESDLPRGATSGVTVNETFELDSALQGQEGLELVRRAYAEGRPYALAFVDIRMPPGWDGVETVARIWKEFPDLQVVICTAYSDYAWDEMAVRLQRTENLLILKKPFDNIEVWQLACAMMEKWQLNRQARLKMDDLEQMVVKRTNELEKQKADLHEALDDLGRTQSQLLQSDKLASIGQLAAGVAHEINNPIGFIFSNLNTLGEYAANLKRVLAAHGDLIAACEAGTTVLPSFAAEIRRTEADVDLTYILSDIDNLIAESVDGANRVRQIVADLRDFSHVDGPDVSESNVNDLMDKTINVAWNELKYKTQVVREYGRVPLIACHGGKLGQVFLNLLVNAAQAIEERGTITVRTGHDDDNASHGERVWIEVADTGCGIPPENLKRIFDPFFTTKEVGKGTGLGLHLARSIVEAHGGQIQVNSEVGKGTSVCIFLPLACALAAQAEPANQPNAAPPTSRRPAGKGKAESSRAPKPASRTVRQTPASMEPTNASRS